MPQDVTDFELCRKLIYQIVDFSLKRRNELFAQGKINATEYVEIRKKIEEPLRKQAKNFTIKIFGNTYQNMVMHQARIDLVTTKLKEVIARIEDFNESINFFSEVITLFGTILSTASSGLAGIPSLLTNLQAIL